MSTPKKGKAFHVSVKVRDHVVFSKKGKKVPTIDEAVTKASRENDPNEWLLALFQTIMDIFREYHLLFPYLCALPADIAPERPPLDPIKAHLDQISAMFYDLPTPPKTSIPKGVGPIAVQLDGIAALKEQENNIRENYYVTLREAVATAVETVSNGISLIGALVIEQSGDLASGYSRVLEAMATTAEEIATMRAATKESQGRVEDFFKRVAALSDSSLTGAARLLLDIERKRLPGDAEVESDPYGETSYRILESFVEKALQMMRAERTDVWNKLVDAVKNTEFASLSLTETRISECIQVIREISRTAENTAMVENVLALAERLDGIRDEELKVLAAEIAASASLAHTAAATWFDIRLGRDAARFLALGDAQARGARLISDASARLAEVINEAERQFASSIEAAHDIATPLLAANHKAFARRALDIEAEKNYRTEAQINAHADAVYAHVHRHNVDAYQSVGSLIRDQVQRVSADVTSLQ